MKAIKDRNRCIESLQKELKRIHSRSTALHLRRRVRKAKKLLNEVVDIVERYDSDLLSIQALKVKNAYLARGMQKERERSSLLLQEKNQLQADFHELRLEKIELKREKCNLERTLLSDLEDFKNTLPNIVQLSDLYSRKIMKYDAMKKRISSGRFSNISFGNKTSTSPISAVNPMVQGCIIQKPTIKVRRVPIPNENRSSMFDYVNVHSPITEVSEETASPANPVTRRCGSGFRNVLNISSRRRTERLQPSTVISDTNNSNTTADEDRANVLLEPVVRLEDVTRLLQHSSIRISETPVTSPANQTRVEGGKSEQWLPEVQIPKTPTPFSLDLSDNPLEGCSWMHRRSSVGPRDQPSKSPSLPKSPFFKEQKNSQSPKVLKGMDDEPVEESELSNSRNDEGVLVSSSNADTDETLPVGITFRRRKRSARSRSRSRSSDADDSHVQSDNESARSRRTHCLRRSTRLSSRPSVITNTSPAEPTSRASAVGDSHEVTKTRSVISSDSGILDPSESRKANKSRKTGPADTTSRVSSADSDSNEVTKTRNVTLNDSEILDPSESRKAKKSKKTSKTNFNVSNLSNSDSEDSSVQSRPRRNRGVVSLKEPSLHTKLRRN